jgi:predicted nuclease of predicted toxin-antitoxin system
VVLTHDLDFGAILAITGGDRTSVVQIRADDLDPDVLGPQVIVAIRRMEDALRAGALLTIDISRARIRMLPLRTAPEA